MVILAFIIILVEDIVDSAYARCQGTSALAVAAPARHHSRWTGVELATYFVGEGVDYHSY